ncbi:acetyltransferase-like isoleucine patch superfamily enzyme [Catenuloplanes nepalensis]|uniref:Acetyltransferase-like isoleucine patch superfamily enzyme n=1 Tax=Catenuloplanes nepalensis TaxID=587533 RepID=A0ABT9MTX0_9ACTN|nr:hypothetical protein [Catenuloplanes nepalensis]MDP9794900.1 acetyltransferase-like isoleucine patch superfamily enzyme [Catenuloplanes nepalensis]
MADQFHGERTLAGAVVTRGLPPSVVAAGSPARVVGSLSAE